MRSVFYAIALVAFTAATSAAQLLEDPRDNKPAGKDDADTPTAAAAGAAARDALPGRPAPRGAAAPQANAMFAAMDSDSDGVISKVELRKAIKALKTLDTDSDGSITLAEASVGGVPAGPGIPLGEDPQVAQIMANDKNGDGKLTPNEVPREMLPMLQGVDQNNDKAIDRAELSGAIANLRNQFGGGPWQNNAFGPAGGARNDQQVTGQFLQYDRNGDGKLTKDELPQQASRMLQDADENGDGAIDAGELQAAMAKMGDRSRALRAGLAPEDARGRGADRNRKRAKQ